MKKALIGIIEKKFNKDFEDISYKIHINKSRIKILADEQRELKNTRKGLFEILSMIRNK